MMLRNLLARWWVIIALVVLTSAMPAQAACKYSLVAKLPVTMKGLVPEIPATINGQPTTFTLDSGAFFSTMSTAKAVAFNLRREPLPPWFYLEGVGGSCSAEYTTIRSFGLSGATLPNVDFVVGGSDTGEGLLGLNFLALGDAEFDLANGTVNLLRARDCNDVMLAYWSDGKGLNVVPLKRPVQDKDRHFYAEATINDHRLQFMLDTGSATSLLYRDAAQAIGIDLDSPDAKPAGFTTGLGRKIRKTWVVRLKSFEFGGESIQNTPFWVIDEASDNGQGVSGLLGADFFLAHHVLVSQSQSKIYFTYNGGPIFSVSTERVLGHQTTREEGDHVADAAEPKDADAFARRAEARLTRGDRAGAIADLGEAIRLTPDAQPTSKARYYRDRSRAYEADQHFDLARADFDSAITLMPQDRDLLLARAWQRLAAHDQAGALADADSVAKLTPAGSLDMTQLVTLYDRLHHSDRALALLDPVIALHKDDARLPMLLGTRCWLRGLANQDLDKALSDCNIALHRAGPSPSLLEYRGLVQFRRHDGAAALADYDAAIKAAEARPNGWHQASPGTYYMRGITRLMLGQTADGQADLAAAIKRDPGLAERFAGFGISPQ